MIFPKNKLIRILNLLAAALIIALLLIICKLIIIQTELSNY